MNSRNETNQNKGEYRIDEMFSEIYETETMNMEDGSELLQEVLTEEEKTRILNLALKKIDTSPIQIENERLYMPTDRARGKKRRILIAVLIAMFAFATTAFAAEIFQWDARFSNHFGIEDQNSAELSRGGMNVGVSAENDGVTIEAVQTIGDGNNMYILLDVTAQEGKTIYPDSGFDMIYLRVDGATSMGYSCNMIDDDNENDNKATFLLAMEANEKINNKKVNLKFENLRHYVIADGDYTSDFAGEWELEWKLDYEDISTKYEIGKELTVNGETVDVDSISISPIALNVQISGSYLKEYDSVPREPGEGDLIQITAITLKDGTELTQDDAASWGCSVRGTDYVMNMQMKKLLNVNQVESITLNDTEIALPVQ